ncbi:uncharacterized protein TNIN_106631 [Trichonephila inaurata madagascariensis]|uniref:Uncharacterized protein n=1 Tax=Trichonephila inaurata madagascariensis TaxID=2747483 RepID=A0A8X6XBJ8_9ARAC|nr:uncharacterized protein TNIN_106631 [Trichonephila inaurata madagascariensis]
MACGPIFTHLIQELYSDSYVAGLGSISDIIKDCKPKGPLTKSLLEFLPKVFDVLEIGIKDCWSIYIDKNLKSIVASPELYVSHVMMMCWVEKNTTPDIYERFLIVLTLVKYMADLVYRTTAKKFYGLTSKILTVFFGNFLREDFNKRGGWKHLEKHILYKKYLEYYDECLLYDFVFDDIPKDLKQRMQDSYSPLQTLGSIFIRKNTINFNVIQDLIREVLRSVETSLLNELSSPTLNEEHSVSKEAGRASSTEANMLDKCSVATSLLKELCSPTLNEEHSLSKEAGRSSSTEANMLDKCSLATSLLKELSSPTLNEEHFFKRSWKIKLH